MPNHVINEVVFEPVYPAQAERVLGLVRNQSMQIDFSLLLPVPLNCWMGSVGADHKNKFPDNALDWCTANWSTKWNAYGEHFADFDGSRLVLRFKTAWRAPYGWLCALFNSSKLPFEYRYFDEGHTDAFVGNFTLTPKAPWSEVEWKERTATGDERDILGALLWGAEAWKEISAERAESA